MNPLSRNPAATESYSYARHSATTVSGRVSVSSVSTKPNENHHSRSGATMESIERAVLQMHKKTIMDLDKKLAELDKQWDAQQSLTHTKNRPSVSSLNEGDQKVERSQSISLSKVDPSITRSRTVSNIREVKPKDSWSSFGASIAAKIKAFSASFGAQSEDEVLKKLSELEEKLKDRKNDIVAMSLAFSAIQHSLKSSEISEKIKTIFERIRTSLSAKVADYQFSKGSYVVNKFFLKFLKKKRTPEGFAFRDAYDKFFAGNNSKVAAKKIWHHYLSPREALKTEQLSHYKKYKDTPIKDPSNKSIPAKPIQVQKGVADDKGNANYSRERQNTFRKMEAMFNGEDYNIRHSHIVNQEVNVADLTALTKEITTLFDGWSGQDKTKSDKFLELLKGPYAEIDAQLEEEYRIFKTSIYFRGLLEWMQLPVTTESISVTTESASAPSQKISNEL